MPSNWLGTVPTKVYSAPKTTGWSETHGVHRGARRVRVSPGLPSLHPSSSQYLNGLIDRFECVFRTRGTSSLCVVSDCVQIIRAPIMQRLHSNRTVRCTQGRAVLCGQQTIGRHRLQGWPSFHPGLRALRHSVRLILPARRLHLPFQIESVGGVVRVQY
jgi:hypothetical protein